MKYIIVVLSKIWSKKSYIQVVKVLNGMQIYYLIQKIYFSRNPRGSSSMREATFCCQHIICDEDIDIKGQ